MTLNEIRGLLRGSGKEGGRITHYIGIIPTYVGFNCYFVTGARNGWSLVFCKGKVLVFAKGSRGRNSQSALAYSHIFYLFSRTQVIYPPVCPLH